MTDTREPLRDFFARIGEYFDPDWLAAAQEHGTTDLVRRGGEWGPDDLTDSPGAAGDRP